MILILALFTLLALQDDLPPRPPSYPGRPPPLADGEAFGGMLGSACDDARGEDGRWYNDHVLSLAPGQRLGIIVSSPDFAPWIQIIDRDGEVVTEAQGKADDQAVGFLFTAAGQPSREFLPPVLYRLRVTSVDVGGVGSWKVEKSYGGRLKPFSSSTFPVRTGCRPLGAVLPD